ncbi:MAG: hypothetical protein H0X27_10370 [Caulobacteraceae bacterium]|nr:hypothetical protein [Caulobacteraceae bacterium]
MSHVQRRTSTGSGAPRLFGVAAAFNFGVGIALLFLRPWLGPLLGLDVIAGTNLVLIDLTAGLILLFGYAYARLAIDAVRYRPYIPIGIGGKLVAVVSAAVPWLAGEISWRLPLLAGADLVFVGLFVAYLRRTASLNA